MYCVHRDGNVIASNASLHEAAEAALTYDGAQFKIEWDDAHQIWELWTKRLSNQRWVKTVLYSFETEQDDAREDIFWKVVGAANGWNNTPTIDPQADWDRWQADAKAEALAE